MATGTWREWTLDDASDWLSEPDADDDKYRRGVLGVITGSPDYPGAAVLGVEAAHRTGVGMVRFTGPRPVRQAVLAARPETVAVPGRVQAWLLGSGMDSSNRTFRLAGDLQHALASGLPSVLDAGGLDLVGSHTGPTVITPHHRELARLLHDRDIPCTVEEIDDDPAAWAERTARQLRVAVLLKGAVTHVCDPDGSRFTVTESTHWLASAGTGDVLGGIIGALAATHHERLSHDAAAITHLAATAAVIHSEAARRASDAWDGGPVTALDVAHAVPGVVGRLLQR
ncbi:ADP-dependent NAD(P)H-hydrate dehydratase [Agromyces sp. M3QZ16-3]|uniref:ADP-dependent NAD(P)H-hydrate dehydratase n=1 Tax=Agromyces sp. M3QZ16-3 TaxID=3447585 RepID=UPI003F690ED9